MRSFSQARHEEEGEFLVILLFSQVSDNLQLFLSLGMDVEVTMICQLFSASGRILSGSTPEL